MKASDNFILAKKQIAWRAVVFAYVWLPINMLCIQLYKPKLLPNVNRARPAENVSEASP